jgi:hypothetical protein
MPAGVFVPFKGFTPSVDPTTPGALLNCQNLVPTVRGMKSAASPLPFGNPAFPAVVTGAATCELLSGAYRTFAGTATDLYEVVGNANNNVSAVAGGYLGGADPWRFAQFGNASLAVNGVDPLQQSVSAGAFEMVPVPLAGITLTAGGANYATPPAVNIAGSGGAVASATITGTIASVAINSGGASYTSAPAVTFSPPPPGGTLATGTATFSGGAVTGVTMTNHGAGYSSASPPTVSFSGGGGSGATGSPVMSGSVTAITLSNAGGTANGGNGYSTVPAITFTGGGGTGAAATATLLQAPSASIIETVQGFVFLLNTTDPVNGARPDGWWNSGLYDQTDWVTSQSTQCENGIIVDQPGAITAGRALGTNIIVYKAQSMYYGVYEGPPVVWAFNLISPNTGTPCQECVVGVGAVQFFLGTDKQVYMFDGTIPQPIGDEVHDWLVSNWSSTYQATVQSYYDKPNSLIYWYFCSASSTGSIDTCLVFNHRTGKFGRADLNIQAAVQTISGQITWQQMGSLPGVSTWSTLPQIPYNSPYWSSSAPNQGIVDSTNTLQSLSGVAAASSLTTGWLGDDFNYIDYLGFLPRFSQAPTTCTGSANGVAQLGQQAPATNWTLGSWYDGELAADFSARYSQVQLSFTGNLEILGMTPRVGIAGEI